MRKFLIQIEHLITIGAGREQFGANKAKPIRGWTRREIADRAGVNEPDLSRMLHGQKIINRAVADRLAEIFFIDLASEDAVQFKKSYEHYAFHAASADLNYFKCSARHRTGDLFLERQSELSYLNTFFKSAKPLLFITDLGGQGKSSLAWNWISFSLRASKVSKDAVMKRTVPFRNVRNVLWYSFYSILSSSTIANYSAFIKWLYESIFLEVPGEILTCGKRKD